MLRRMAARKELKCQEFDTSPDWFMLNSTQRIKDPRKYHHETGAADLFTVYYPHLKEQGGKWKYEPAVLKERADRGMRLFNRTIYFEVDRATESPTEIGTKLDNYIRYAQETNSTFHVVFVLMDGKETAQARGRKLLPLLLERRRANQFLIASHQRLIQDPLGKVLFSPLNELYSVSDVA